MGELDAVTRIRVQTDLGRYEFWSDKWELEIQDDNRTLYLRGRGAGDHAKTRRDLEAAEATLSGRSTE